jgi:hypothetical protein
MFRRVIATGALLFASNAYAQSSSLPAGSGTPTDAAAPEESPRILQAREAFRLGSTLAKQGRWSDALAAFERSAHLKEHPVTTYNLAYCARALGQFVHAYQGFQAALAPSAAASGATLPEDYQTQARAYLVELEQRVAHATVTLEAPDMSLRVDGRPVAVLRNDTNRAAYVASSEEPAAPPRLPAQFDLWLDPGNHVFTMSQQGIADVTRVQSFSPGAVGTLRFRAPASPSPSPPPNQEIELAPGKPDRTWAFVSLGVGAAGFVASGVFAILSLNLKSDLESRCGPNGACSASDATDVDNVKRFADYSTVGLIVGGVGTAIGAALWFTATPTREHAGITPWLGIGSAGVTAKF